MRISGWLKLIISLFHALNNFTPSHTLLFLHCQLVVGQLGIVRHINVDARLPQGGNSLAT